MKRARSVELFSLFVAIGLLMLFSPLTSKAQTPSSSNLEGTRWKAAVSITLNGGDITQVIEYKYDFSDKSKVKVAYISRLYGFKTVSRYSSLTGRDEPTSEVTLESVVSGNEVASYKRIGNKIQIECSDHQIDATIGSGGMNGTIAYKRSNDKAKWTAIKDAVTSNRATTSVGVDFSDTLKAGEEDLIRRGVNWKRESSNEYSSYPNVIRNKDGSLRPAGGYQWVSPRERNDFRVELMPHLLRLPAGMIFPEKGYRWLFPRDESDYRVEPIP